MTNPVDSYLEKYGGQTKEASAWNVAGNVAMTAALAFGAVAVPRIIEKMSDAATKKQDFQKMLQSDPVIAERYANNPHEVANNFSSLRRVAPEFTKEPMVAAAYMHRMKGDPATAGFQLVDASEKSQSTFGKRHPRLSGPTFSISMDHNAMPGIGLGVR